MPFSNCRCDILLWRHLQ